MERILKKTTEGRTMVATSTAKMTSAAVLTEVNVVMAKYAANLPEKFRGAVMKLLFEAIREGGLRIYYGRALSGENKGKLEKRHILRAGTAYTPYTMKTDAWDGRRNIKDRIENTGGIKIQKYLENLCELFVQGLVNPIDGVTQAQFESCVKGCFRNYRVRQDDEWIKEIG